MFCPKMGHRFERRRGIGPMTDDGHNGEGEHDERDMPVPAMPGAGFVVVEAEFVRKREAGAVQCLTG